MYNLEDIRAIHFEPTERCNLSCLMCDRNMDGGDVNPFLKDRELELSVIKRTFSPFFIQQLKMIYMCGNYGDPILAQDIMQILKYFRSWNPDMSIKIITNGCSRQTLWWRELANVVSAVRFGIDGLGDTHKLYRQNASWDLIIRNASAYINAGGYAIWDYLVFRHNEHQIEKARSLSKLLGFKEFVVKKTGRFFSNIKLTGKDEHEGLKKPKDEKNINESLKKEEQIIKTYGSMENYLDKTQIICKVQKSKEIYISAEGIVLPCCWLGCQLYKWYLPEKSTQIWDIINKVGKEKININNFSLEQIFETGIFTEISESWNKNSCLEGKQKTCALKCGKELDQFGDQYK